MTATRSDSASLVRAARDAGLVIPAFNIPYLPMMAPVVQALRDSDCLGMIMVARLEWVKFSSGSPQAVAAEYQHQKDPRHTRLHLDHVPVIDEDQLQVPYAEEIRGALDAGYESVMVDGSRLGLAGNIAATASICELAQGYGVPVEGELGAVMGHEAGPMPPYEELFTSGKGFTDPQEARRFVQETGVDWLSVAIGSVHGAISAAKRGAAKIRARLSIPQLQAIRAAVDVPFVLHGGTGIGRAYVQQAIAAGIAKINVATAIRQPYEARMDQDHDAALDGVYTAARRVIDEDLACAGSATRLGL
ncbi:MAG: class II fructose-bisphosphate aldolase [Planctomycetota bacterium]